MNEELFSAKIVVNKIHVYGLYVLRLYTYVGGLIEVTAVFMELLSNSVYGKSGNSFS